MIITTAATKYYIKIVISTATTKCYITVRYFNGYNNTLYKNNLFNNYNKKVTIAIITNYNTIIKSQNTIRRKINYGYDS